MKDLARSVKSMLGIDLQFCAVLKWGEPGKNQVRSKMALLQLTWKETKKGSHGRRRRRSITTNLADWLDKLMTARYELEVAGQAIGDKVFFTMVLDSFNGGKQGEAYGC